MKTTLTILLSFVFLSVHAELKPFDLKGSITGLKTFKYAYFFDNGFKLIKRVDVKNNTFEILGTFSTDLRFGELPFIKVLLSDKEASGEQILSDNPLSNRRHNQCTVIADDKIEVIYNSDKKLFNILGSAKNTLQSAFEQNHANFRNRRDSSNASIDKLALSDDEKAEKKEIEARKLMDSTISKMVTLIKDNPDSEVSLFNFGPVILDQNTHGEMVMKLYENFSPRIKKLEYYKYTLRDVEDKLANEERSLQADYTIGMTLPDFSLPDTKGLLFGTRSAFGKYTLIDFWATWCQPCRKETPNLINAFNKYQSKGFNIMTISIDSEKDKAKWLSVIESDGMSKFINLFNGNDKSGIARELKITAIPANYLIDSNGKILARNLRGEELNAFLAGLYKTK